MKEFESPNDWQKFCEHITHKNRYILSLKQKKFLETVLQTAKNREHTLLKGGALHRARIGLRKEKCDGKDGVEKILPFAPKDLGAPPSLTCTEGRLNPRGIPYLYLANYISTAVSEVRPWLGAEVSVGHFAIQKDLKVVDTSKDKAGFWIGSDPSKLSPEKKELYVWSRINASFSKPVAPIESHFEYIPTQVLAELFKNNGYDGVIYKSAMTDEGYNIVLFDPKGVRLCAAQALEIKMLKYDYDPCATPYSCKNK